MPRGKLSNVPELPPHFLPRPEELQPLKEKVLVQTNQRVVVTDRARRVGVQGMGGIGKTVLAIALARDEEVRRAFPDGVFWITVGQTPELTALQLQLAKALSPDRQQPFTNQSDGAACLREFLASKTCLLLLDDVWQTKHLKAFVALGQNCQMLITTRNCELITDLGAIEYPLDVLSHDQALRLLALWADQEVVEKLPQEAHSVAQECGHLPLALAMIGAMVRGKPDRWGNVLHKLQSADLEKIRRDFSHYPYPNLLAAIQVSVDNLDPEMQSRYLDFAVFPEGTPIPEAVLQTLWETQELDQYDLQDVVDHLVGRSLVRRDHQGHLSLHDLQLDYVRKQFDDLTKLHSQLLEVYKRKTEGGLWHTLPNDGYIHARLTWHLEKAGWVDEIHKLLREETKSGLNGWHEACERLGQTANFVTDVARAWQLATQMFKDRPSQAIALQCRYALITASLNSLAPKLLEGFLVALVKKNVWSPRQGVAYALMLGSYQKVKSLTALAKYLPQNLKEQALQAAWQSVWGIQDESERAEALSALVDKMPAELLPEALQGARAIHSKSARALALSALVDKLPSVLSETLRVVWTIEPESSRVVALRALVDKLPAELVTQALRQVWTFQSEVPRADALRALVDKLPAELLPEALQGARAIHSKWARALALSALVNKLPSVLSETLQTVRAIQHEWARADALSTLIDKLPAELMPEALEVAKAIKSEDFRTDALCAIMTKLPAELIPEALQAVRAIRDEWARIRALCAIANKLPAVLPEVLQAVRAIQNNWDRQSIQIPGNSACADVLTTIADNLPADLVSEALQVVKAIQDDWACVRALNALTNKLSAELMPEVLQVVRAIQDESARAQAVSAIADNLPDELIPQALQVARVIQDDWACALALSAIADNLPSVLAEALQAVRATQNKLARADALSIIANKLPPELMPELLQAVWATQEYRWTRFYEVTARAMSAIADKLPSLLFEALEAARKIQDRWVREPALVAIANNLPAELAPGTLMAIANNLPAELAPEDLPQEWAIEEDERDRALILIHIADKLPADLMSEALEIAKAIQDEKECAHALMAIVDKLPAELVPEALQAVRAIQNESARARVLNAIANNLPSVLPEALQAVRAIQDESDRAEALSALVDKLPSELTPEALQAARAIRNKMARALALSALVDKLPSVFSETLQTVRAIQNEKDRAEALRALADKRPEVLPEALAATRAIQSEWARADALSASADKRPEVLPEALAAAMAIPSGTNRADVLKALASKLSKMQPGELFPLWENILYLLSLGTRSNLLQEIAALVPVIGALGGPAAVAEIARAIQDVGRWWP